MLWKGEKVQYEALRINLQGDGDNNRLLSSVQDQNKVVLLHLGPVLAEALIAGVLHKETVKPLLDCSFIPAVSRSSAVVDGSSAAAGTSASAASTASSPRGVSAFGSSSATANTAAGSRDSAMTTAKSSAPKRSHVDHLSFSRTPCRALQKVFSRKSFGTQTSKTYDFLYSRLCWNATIFLCNILLFVVQNSLW